MNDKEKVDFKIILKRKCISIIEERIIACQQAIESAQESANNEEKSSAGDKYETGRAMAISKKICMQSSLQLIGMTWPACFLSVAIK